jgi:hypothetical protein
MKKFISTEEGVWQEVTRVTSETPDTDAEKVLEPASPEDIVKLEEVYLANKPEGNGKSVFTLLKASIRLDETSARGTIIGRMNAQHMHIRIK